MRGAVATLVTTSHFMKNHLVALVGATAALAFVSCATPTPKLDTMAPSFSTAAAKASLDSMNKNYDGRFRDSTTSYFAARYTADACVFPPNMPRVCGIEEITRFYWFGGDSQTLTLDIQGQEVSGTEQEVTEVGTYRVIDDEGTVMDEGKFIAIYRSEGGNWKVHREIWNSDRAAPPATADTVADAG